MLNTRVESQLSAYRLTLFETQVSIIIRSVAAGKKSFNVVQMLLLRPMVHFSNKYINNCTYSVPSLSRHRSSTYQAERAHAGLVAVRVAPLKQNNAQAIRESRN